MNLIWTLQQLHEDMANASCHGKRRSRSGDLAMVRVRLCTGKAQCAMRVQYQWRAGERCAEPATIPPAIP
ncbi:hypothetical protein, partial [Xanthomonas citri]|uniref:hypothetical protein n=1 Tax=Xanthomonas citri TaxID=346 RepID=UPI001A961B80